MNKIQFKSRKEASEFLASKDIDTSKWTEEKWQSINKSQAEIHIQALAEAMWDAKNKSIPKDLKPGEWHIPFGDQMTGDVTKWFSTIEDQAYWLGKDMTNLFLKVATARCARLSYMTFDGEIDYKKDIQLHDMLLENKHMSPFEHCARVPFNKMDEEGWTHTDSGGNLWSGNFKNWIQYRQLL